MSEQIDFWDGYVLIDIFAPLDGNQQDLVGYGFKQLTDLTATEPQDLYQTKEALPVNGTVYQHILEAKWNMAAIVAATPEVLINQIQLGIEQQLGFTLPVKIWQIASTTFFGLNDANGDPIAASGYPLAKNNFDAEIQAAWQRGNSKELSHQACLDYLAANIEAWETPT